jgi:hypothetical protein
MVVKAWKCSPAVGTNATRIGRTSAHPAGSSRLERYFKFFCLGRAVVSELSLRLPTLTGQPRRLSGDKLPSVPVEHHEANLAHREDPNQRQTGPVTLRDPLCASGAGLTTEEEGETSRERMRARTLLTAISNRRKAIGEGADEATVKRLNDAVGEASRNARQAGYTPMQSSASSLHRPMCRCSADYRRRTRGRSCARPTTRSSSATSRTPTPRSGPRRARNAPASGQRRRHRHRAQRPPKGCRIASIVRTSSHAAPAIGTTSITKGEIAGRGPAARESVVGEVTSGTAHQWLQVFPALTLR